MKILSNKTIQQIKKALEDGRNEIVIRHMQFHSKPIKETINDLRCTGFFQEIEEAIKKLE